MNTFLRLITIIFSIGISFAQDADIVQVSGQIETEESLADIHIINKTSEKFTVTNALGAFRITVKLNDTLVISSLQHKLKTVIINDEIISNKQLVINLETEINALDEIVLGRILTGDIITDIGSVKNEPITPNKVGISSYQGKPKTQSERRLYEAISGGGLIPLSPIINGINGTTKKLKERVLLEEKDALIFKIKDRFEDEFFQTHPLDKNLQMDFFYFCSDDLNFLNRCKNRTDFGILIFLIEKYEAYIENSKLKDD